jgi:HK97 family phage portal protein
VSLLFNRSLSMPTASDLLGLRRSSRGLNAVGSMTGDRAMRHSAVWACLRLRADLLSTMPLDVFKRVGGVQVEVSKPPVLVAPSGSRVDITEWMYSSQIDLDRFGNCFGHITEVNNYALPARIDLLPAEGMTVLVKNGQLDGYRFMGKRFEVDEIWHEKQFTVAGMHVGLSPVAYSALAVTGYLSALEFAQDWFNAGGIPRSRLKNVNKKIDPDEAEIIKRRFNATLENGDVFVHGSDWEYEMLAAKASESNYLDAAKMSISDAGRFYGVPGDLIDAETAAGSITYANISQRNLQLLIMNLGPAVTRRENALTKLTPKPWYVKLNSDALLRMDPKTRAELFKTQIDSRQRAPSECRELDNLPPFTPSSSTRSTRCSRRRCHSSL